MARMHAIRGPFSDPTVMNAIRDALGPAADGLDMPATPEKLWRLIRAGRREAA